MNTCLRILKSRKWKGITIVIIVSVVALLFFLFIWIVVEAYYYQEIIGSQLRQDLGFSHGSPYVTINGVLCEVMTIENVKLGGIFSKAGFQDGDILLGEESITDFYKKLQNSRGYEIYIEVVSYNAVEPLLNKERRKLKVYIPLKK